MNLRSYPDFFAVDNRGTRWLLDTKGTMVSKRCTGTKWEYLKVPQRGFETLQPSRLEHLIALKPAVVT